VAVPLKLIVVILEMDPAVLTRLAGLLSRIPEAAHCNVIGLTGTAWPHEGTPGRDGDRHHRIATAGNTVSLRIYRPPSCRQPIRKPGKLTARARTGGG